VQQLEAFVAHRAAAVRHEVKVLTLHPQTHTPKRNQEQDANKTFDGSN